MIAGTDLGGFNSDRFDIPFLVEKFMNLGIDITELKFRSIDVQTIFHKYERRTLGAAYRLDAAFSGLVGFQLTDQFFVGYSYDADTQKLSNYNSGSHEFMLRFELFKRHNRYVSPRFF